MTSVLHTALQRLLGLFQLQPHRELYDALGNAASDSRIDAAQDEPRQGSAGSLVVDGDGNRFAYT